MFGFQVSIELAWNHVSINHLVSTDYTLDLSNADIPGALIVTHREFLHTL